MLEKCIKDDVASADVSVAYQPQNQPKLINMKSMTVVAFALVAVAVAVAIPVDKEPVKILRSDFQQQPEGSYNFGFEAENGIKREETGELKQVLDEEKKPHDVVVVRGSYSFPNEEGKPETVNYYADETGYHAEGDSIPKAVRR